MSRPDGAPQVKEEAESVGGGVGLCSPSNSASLYSPCTTTALPSDVSDSGTRNCHTLFVSSSGVHSLCRLHQIDFCDDTSEGRRYSVASPGGGVSPDRQFCSSTTQPASGHLEVS